MGFSISDLVARLKRSQLNLTDQQVEQVRARTMGAAALLVLGCLTDDEINEISEDISCALEMIEAGNPGGEVAQ